MNRKRNVTGNNSRQNCVKVLEWNLKRCGPEGSIIEGKRADDRCVVEVHLTRLRNSSQQQPVM